MWLTKVVNGYNNVRKYIERWGKDLKSRRLDLVLRVECMVTLQELKLAVLLPRCRCNLDSE